MNAEMTLQLEKRRWWILAVIGLINLCAGSIYAWSVLAAASAAKLSSVLGTAVTPGDLAIAFGVANAVGPIPMILGGAINDRFGPRTVIVAGGFLMGLGLICCGLAESVGTLIAAYGGLFGLGLGLTYGACITTAVRYFPDRRGMAGGIVTAAYGMSSVLVPPIAQALIGSVGIKPARRGSRQILTNQRVDRIHGKCFLCQQNPASSPLCRIFQNFQIFL